MLELADTISVSVAYPRDVKGALHLSQGLVRAVVVLHAGSEERFG